MYEPATPPKKQVSYLWLLVGLVALCACLLAIAVSNGGAAANSGEALATAEAAAAKNAEALKAAESSSAARERLLQVQIESLSAVIKQAESRQVLLASKLAAYQAGEQVTLKRLEEARDRVNEVNAELAKSRDGSELKESIALRKKAEADLEVASTALRDANAKLAASLSRHAELEEDSRRLSLEIARITGSPVREDRRVARRDEKWIKLNEDFLAKIDADVSIKKSSSGLRYKIIDEGHPAKPNTASSVSCRYEGKLVDGKVFDTTKSRNNEPTEFPLAGVIPAWTEGVQYIGAGGKIILYCPSALAYGDEGQGPIPGRSVLIFEVELVEITKFR